MEAHRIQVAKDREMMTIQARLNANAFRVQDDRRTASEAETRRIAHAAALLTLAKEREAAAKESKFQDDRSAASSIVRKKHGVGRHANLQLTLNQQLNQNPPTHKKQQVNHVRNEEAVEGFGRKLARGVSSLLGR